MGNQNIEISSKYGFYQMKISGADYIAKFNPTLILHGLSGDWYEDPIYGDEKPLILISDLGLVYTTRMYDTDDDDPELVGEDLEILKT